MPVLGWVGASHIAHSGVRVEKGTSDIAGAGFGEWLGQVTLPTLRLGMGVKASQIDYTGERGVGACKICSNKTVGDYVCIQHRAPDAFV